MSRKSEAVSIADYEEEGRKTLDGDAFIYYNSGADGEATLNENKIACRRYRLRPRVLRGLTEVDISSTIIGHPISFPVCVAPSAWHRFCNLDAEIATAKGAVEAGVAMALSSDSTTHCRELPPKFPEGIFFMQSYVVKSKTLHERMLCRLKEFGYKAVVLSVDCPVVSKRRKQFGPSMSQRLRSREMHSINYLQEEEESQAAYDKGPSEFYDFLNGQVHDSTPVNLDIIQWIKTCSGLSVVVKGILTGKAACLAVDNGADAVWISNHGGRQLDFTPSTIDVLTEVVEAVKCSNIEVYIDSGFRTGNDVFKALALGAQAVFIGRPVLWGLSVAGSSGVRDILEILKEELRLCMTLAGCPNVQSITRGHVIQESQYLASKL